MARLHFPLISLLLLGAACADSPTGARTPAEPAYTVSEVRCTASVSTASLSCTGQSLGAEGPRLAQITVGGQHRYVRLQSSGIAVAEGIFSFDATVQNLLQEPMGTADGTTGHAAGVRVVFASLTGTGGSGVASVA